MKTLPENFTFPIIDVDETVSTNQYLSQLCNEQPESVAEYTTVTAQFQSAGKGQRGNSWESEKGKNLLFSIVLYPTFLEPRRQFILSQIASLAIKEELNRWSNDFFIKWPNDIYYREQKICGMLIENELTGRSISRCIFGIRLNVNQEIFRSDAPNPVSLKQITGKEQNREEILTHILKRMKIYYEGLRMEDPQTYADEVNARYARSLFRRRGYHMYPPAARRSGRSLCAGRREREGTQLPVQGSTIRAVGTKPAAGKGGNRPAQSSVVTPTYCSTATCR